MFSVEDHGSIVLVHPHTNDVRDWLRDNVDPEAQWFGRALVVEPRYVEQLVTALVDEGFATQ